MSTANLPHVGRTLVLAPHPDDEVLGCGGTIARLSACGQEVHVGIVTRGEEPAFSRQQVQQVREELAQAHAILGVTGCHFLDLPAAALDTVPAARINAAIGELVASIRPQTLFLPFFGDIHRDHQLVFTAGLVAARPRDAAAPRRIYAYETLSETNWAGPGVNEAFVPNAYFDISETLPLKLRAFACFTSQIKAFPDERSLETIEALARIRGSTVFAEAAEAFMLLREIT